MGKHWGNLAYIRGMIYYVISPHEQKAIPFNLKERIPGAIQNTRYTIWRWLPVWIVGYSIFRYGEYLHWSYSRKVRADFDNEVEPEEIIMCERPVEPLPTCKDEMVYEEYPCAPGEERKPRV